MLRLGSAWYDVATQVKAITEQGLDSRNFILCTDDSHSGTLVNDGHMNRVVRHAIAQGLKPITAIQMATLNTAEHFGVEKDIGSITPGRYADIVISSDLVDAAHRNWSLPVEKLWRKTAVLPSIFPPTTTPTSPKTPSNSAKHSPLPTSTSQDLQGFRNP